MNLVFSEAEEDKMEVDDVDPISESCFDFFKKPFPVPETCEILNEALEFYKLVFKEKFS